MIKVKVLDTSFDSQDLENKLNQLLKTEAVEEVISLTTTRMYDVYPHDGSVCNEWVRTIMAFRTKEVLGDE